MMAQDETLKNTETDSEGATCPNSATLSDKALYSVYSPSECVRSTHCAGLLSTFPLTPPFSLLHFLSQHGHLPQLVRSHALLSPTFTGAQMAKSPLVIEAGRI